jgi:hypothetical protein
METLAAEEDRAFAAVEPEAADTLVYTRGSARTREREKPRTLPEPSCCFALDPFNLRPHKGI